MPNQELLIDEQSASITLDDQAVRSWGGRQRVFVSSLIVDLPAEREAARLAIEAVGATPVMFEDLGGQDISAQKAYLAGLRSSSVYIGIFGSRYGIRLASGYSATEEEFRLAQQLGIRIGIFTKGADSVEMDGGQRDLIAGVRNALTTSPWTDPTDLRLRIERRLRDLAAEELAPWVRLDDTVFRAREITSDGTSVTIHADVRDARVSARLVELRDARRSDVRFTYADESRLVQIKSISSTMTATSGRDLTITLNVREQQGQGMRMGSTTIGGTSYSAEELAKRSLSDTLFGTNTVPNQLGFGRSVADPLSAIRGRQLDDQIVRPVARLLITEHLLSNGDARTVDSFTLGPEHNGQRLLRVAWTPPRTYSNEPVGASVTVSGKVSGL
jgi:phosphotransferase system HPr-like phosphotransfer protein